MTISRWTPILYGPQTFNFIAKLKRSIALPQPQNGPLFNLDIKLNGPPWASIGGLSSPFNLAIKLNVCGLLKVGVPFEQYISVLLSRTSLLCSALAL